MSDSLSPELARDIDRLCDCFEDAWQRGQRPTIEAHLDQFPRAAQLPLLLQLIRLEVELRRQAGEVVALEDYRERFPAWQAELAPLFAVTLAVVPIFRVTLSVIKGPHTGRSFTCDGHDTFVVGRAPEANFSLPDDGWMSRFHFIIEVNPPLCRLVDLQSRSGTLVNGVPVESANLQDGDRIKTGQTSILVRLEGGTHLDSTETAPPAALVQETLGQAIAESELPEVPGYRLVRKLGAGGMGVVYEAVRAADGVTVAVKTLRPALRHGSKEMEARFLREAEILRALRHPHIVALHEFGRAEELLYIAMEYVPGKNAAELVRDEGPLEIGRAVRLTCQLLEALAYAHGQKVIHRDIKPANLLVGQEAGREVAKLSDFGLAKIWQDSPLSGLTVTGEVAGTAAYMPPEQVLNFRSMQPAGDQYSAAATLYTLLTGRPLFEQAKSPQAAFKQVLEKEPVPLRDCRPEVPEALAVVVHRALARQPEGRFRDVAALAESLGPFVR